LHQKFRLEFRGGVLGNSPCAGMSPLNNIVKKDPLGRKMPKNDATVKLVIPVMTKMIQFLCFFITNVPTRICLMIFLIQIFVFKGVFRFILWKTIKLSIKEKILD